MVGSEVATSKSDKGKSSLRLCKIDTWLSKQEKLCNDEEKSRYEKLRMNKNSSKHASPCNKKEKFMSITSKANKLTSTFSGPHDNNATSKHAGFRSSEENSKVPLSNINDNEANRAKERRNEKEPMTTWPSTGRESIAPAVAKPKVDAVSSE